MQHSSTKSALFQSRKKVIKKWQYYCRFHWTKLASPISMKNLTEPNYRLLLNDHKQGVAASLGINEAGFFKFIFFQELCLQATDFSLSSILSKVSLVPMCWSINDPNLGQVLMVIPTSIPAGSSLSWCNGWMRTTRSPSISYTARTLETRRTRWATNYANPTLSLWWLQWRAALRRGQGFESGQSSFLRNIVYYLARNWKLKKKMHGLYETSDLLRLEKIFLDEKLQS